MSSVLKKADKLNLSLSRFSCQMDTDEIAHTAKIDKIWVVYQLPIGIGSIRL